MRMVQMTVHQVIQVISVRNRRMPATRAVHVPFLMPAALMAWGAAVRVDGGNFQHALVHMISVDVMQLAVMQVVHMTVVVDGRMPATWAMLVRMSMNLIAVAHCESS